MLSRGKFLRAAMGLTGAAVGMGLAAPKQAAAATAAAAVEQRTYASGRFGLVLGGANQGLLRAFDGGNPYGRVVRAAPGPGNGHHGKHIAAVAYEPLHLEVDLGMQAGIYALVSTTSKGQHTREDGAIHAFDASGAHLYERQFTNATLASVTVPTLDGSSKEPFSLGLTLAPEMTRDVKSNGAKLPSGSKLKQSLASNFRLRLPGVDTSRVMRIESFSLRVSGSPDALGSESEFVLQPRGALEVPDLKLTIAQSGADSWREWFNKFVVQGNNERSTYKDGSLSLLGPDLRTELLRIDLDGVGIYSFGPARAEANADQVVRFEVELFCEKMTFNFNP